jgi:hypothetical protein
VSGTFFSPALLLIQATESIFRYELAAPAFLHMIEAGHEIGTLIRNFASTKKSEFLFLNSVQSFEFVA